MGYLIATRNPRTKKLVIITEGEGDDVAEFETEEAASDAASNTTICKAWGYELIETPGL